MKYHAFEVFSWLPWLIIAMALAGVALLIVLAVRARRVLWKVVLALCVPVCMIASCAGFIYAAYIDVPPTNASAPVPDSLSISFLQYPDNSATAVTTLNAHTGAVPAQHAIDGLSRLFVRDERTIYLVSNPLQIIIAVRASDAQERWRTPLTNSLDPQHLLNFLDPPIVADGMLFISAGTTNPDAAPGALVFALHADTGALAWRLTIKGPTLETRLLAAEQGMLFVENIPNGDIVALRESDGVQVWSAPGPAHRKSTDLCRWGGVSPSIPTDRWARRLQWQADLVVSRGRATNHFIP
jgi:putative pyrroloquinoline-quinone binding quinoprotein